MPSMPAHLALICNFNIARRALSSSRCFFFLRRRAVVIFARLSCSLHGPVSFLSRVTCRCMYLGGIVPSACTPDWKARINEVFRWWCSICCSLRWRCMKYRVEENVTKSGIFFFSRCVLSRFFDCVGNCFVVGFDGCELFDDLVNENYLNYEIEYDNRVDCSEKE